MKRLQALVAWLDKRFPPTGVAWLEVSTLLATFAAAAVATWKFLAADTAQLTELLKAVAWPAVVCAGLIAFRDPISRFLSGLARRVRKFSAFNVEFELTDVTAKQVTGPVLADIKSGEPIFVADSAGQIFAQLLDERRADYVVIDLGDGQEWLLSRLFIVAAMFGGMRGVRCMVFTAGTAGHADALIGIASLDEVRWRLARICPWFEIALAKAVTSALQYEPAQMLPGTQMFRTDCGGYEPYIAATIVRTFLTLLQVNTAPSTAGWEKIHDNPPVWERAEWVTTSVLRTLFGDFLSKASVINPGERSKQDVARSVLSQPGSFVAGITSGRFNELFDRVTLLEQVGRQVAMAGDDVAARDDQ
jgi:hypothetical protein